jgi:nucleotide-binding universal stress UspA family protein
MQIEIYSIKGFTGSALRDRLSHALIEQRIESEITEINSVEQFVRAGIHSVPAIRVGERIFLHSPNAKIEETIGQVMDFIVKGSPPSILVPIDFSPESLHALQYAATMAEALQLGLTLTHIHLPIYDPVSGGACDVLLQKENTSQLHDLADQLRQDFRQREILLPVDIHLESGDPSTNLIQLSSSEQYKLIVMATKGKDTAFRRLFSTITAHVGRHSHKPVMIVPPQSELKFPTQWLIGFDHALLEKASMDQIWDFHREQVKTMLFTHITNPRKPIDENLLLQFCQKIKGFTDQKTEMKCETIQPLGDPVDEILLQKAKTEHADLMVLFSQQRSFIESLQHSSVIRKVIQQPPLPVLIIPL